MEWTKEERKSKALTLAAVIYIITHVVWALTEGSYSGWSTPNRIGVILNEVLMLGSASFVPVFILTFIFPEIYNLTKWLQSSITGKYTKKSSISQLKEYKGLLDKGIITKEEYDKVSEPLKKKVI